MSGKCFLFRQVAAHSRRGPSLAMATALVLTSLLPLSAIASPSEDDPKPQQGTSGGFAFGAPRGFFLIKGGLYAPRAESDIYTFNAEQLTLDVNSYNAFLFGMDIGVSLNDRVDLVFGFEYSGSSPVSEFRDWVDEFDAPIVQQTRLRQVPLTASIRLNLIERGRSVGNYAWVPKGAVPYVGAGGGITWWRYEQFGDFIDFADFTIFTEHFLTEGWDPPCTSSVASTSTCRHASRSTSRLATAGPRASWHRLSSASSPSTSPASEASPVSRSVSDVGWKTKPQHLRRPVGERRKSNASPNEALRSRRSVPVCGTRPDERCHRPTSRSAAGTARPGAPGRKVVAVAGLLGIDGRCRRLSRGRGEWPAGRLRRAATRRRRRQPRDPPR